MEGISTILIAEDDERIGDLLETYLKKEGYALLRAENGARALEIIEKETVHCLILDVMMPEKDGFEVLQELRKKGDLPILLLTARGEEEDKLEGFQLGADDYVTKPFSPKEVVARVKVLLRRGGGEKGREEKEGKEKKRVFHDLTLYPERHEAYLKEERLHLTPKEYDLLEYLLNNPNHALSRDQLLNGVWGYDYFGDLRTVDTHIKRLRKKLGAMGEAVETLRGVGYRLNPNPSKKQEEPGDGQ